MGPLGPPELIIILLIVLLLFGGKKLPELFRSMGKGISEFKQGMKEGETEPKPADASEKKDDASSQG